MSIENQQEVTFDESKIDPNLLSYLESKYDKKYQPIIAKRDELLGKLSTYKSLEEEVKTLGGLDNIRSLKSKVDAEAAAAEQARIAALSKEDKLSEIELHFSKLIAEKDDKLNRFQQSLINKEVESALNKAIIESEGVPLLLVPHLRNRVESSIDEEGNIKIVVKGKAGETMDSSGQPLTLKSLVEEARSNPDLAPAFKAHVASGGSGRTSSGGTSSKMNPFAKNTQNITEQSILIRSQPALAEKLAADAGVKKFW